MARPVFASILRGGDRRSIGEANRTVTLIIRKPERFQELLECLWHDDPVVRMRAADAAEKISAQRPELLYPFKAELLGLAAETSQQELRWHLALIIPRLPLTETERERGCALLREFLNDRISIKKGSIKNGSIVKTCALQGLAELARGDPELKAEVAEIMEQASRNGTAAMRARARKLLPRLQD